jgi:2-dehydropantoate 2-reductase
MKILVFGAGAVGGYLGARLSHAGHDVTLVARAAMAENINQNGLSIVEESARLVARPRALFSLRQAFLEDDAYDAILLGMKSYDTETALNELVAFCPAPPTLITLQNGIGVEEPFMQQFGPEKVIAGSVTIPLSMSSSHTITAEHSGRGLALAPTIARQPVGQWANLFQEAGVNTIKVSRYQSMKWSKALLNIMGNASAAIINRHPRVVYGYTPTFNLEMAMLREALAVMRKLKIKAIDLPGAEAKKLSKALYWLPNFILKPVITRRVAEGRGEKMPSFHVDLSAGKEKNEVAYHNEAIARIGREQGLKMPVNTVLADLLLKLARKEVDWRDFDGQPKRLLLEINRFRQTQR